jgi:hypothetical protein
MDLTKTINWFDIPLEYSEHAVDRCNERNTPMYSYLPIKAKFLASNVTMSGQVYKFLIKSGFDDLCMIITTSGLVVTIYYIGNKKQARNRFRRVDYDKYPNLEVERQIHSKYA